MHPLDLLCLLANVGGREAPHTKGRDRGEPGTQPDHVMVHCQLIATYCQFCFLSPCMWPEMVPKLLELQMGRGLLGQGSPWFCLAVWRCLALYMTDLEQEVPSGLSVFSEV